MVKKLQWPVVLVLGVCHLFLCARKFIVSQPSYGTKLQQDWLSDVKHCPPLLIHYTRISALQPQISTSRKFNICTSLSYLSTLINNPFDSLASIFQGQHQILELIHMKSNVPSVSHPMFLSVSRPSSQRNGNGAPVLGALQIQCLQSASLCKNIHLHTG